MRRRRGWDGRFQRSRAYVEDATRIGAGEARARAALMPGCRGVRLVIGGAVSVDVGVRWHPQPQASRGGGGGWAMTLTCPCCGDSRRSLYLLRAPSPFVGCRGCLGLAYRSQGVPRGERLRVKADRWAELAGAPRRWTSTRLRALRAYQAAEGAYWQDRMSRWPAWMGRPPALDGL
jgi:hypothetical protein